ncbi:MAG: tetratricopeptide repeat protein, partial [Gammaproteobacteria bacterium]
MDDKRDTAKQSDALLWLAGAIVVGMGGIWLVLSKPWASDDSIETYTATVSTRPAVPSPEPSQAGRTNLETPLEDNPLRMAQLALEAGMLVEPEEYSAWTLFRKVLQQDPNNTEARDGLDRIATELLRRANAAVEQGRFEDARATVARIREVFPVHTGANDLAIRIDTLTRRAAALAQRSNVLDDDDEPAAPREPERAPEREP